MQDDLFAEDEAFGVRGNVSTPRTAQKHTRETRVRRETGSGSSPLADRMRPADLDEVVGQDHVLGHGSMLRSAIENDHVPSIVLWGPPGSGKTTIARLIQKHTKAHFVSLSAVLSGVRDVRQVVERARRAFSFEGRKTILFVDEIHRFNKAQQDAFLPHVEDGTLTLVGATTENPFFEMTAPLISRCSVIRLKPLDEAAIMQILKRTVTDDQRGLGGSAITISEEALGRIARASDGDARRALNALEAACLLTERRGAKNVTVDMVQEAFALKGVRYDRDREEHYNLASAFIKSLRGSDPDAAVYYMARMLEGGEDPSFICRRMIIFASEDIGNADPLALGVAMWTKEAFEFVGMPEAAIPLAQAVTYLACAPKSNASYRALKAAQAAVKEYGTLDVPMHILNAPVKGMAELGYGQGYAYPHDYEGHFVPVHYLPKSLRGRHFYEPTEQGHEKPIRERLEKWRELRTRKATTDHEESDVRT